MDFFIDLDPLPDGRPSSTACRTGSRRVRRFFAAAFLVLASVIIGSFVVIDRAVDVAMRGMTPRTATPTSGRDDPLVPLPTAGPGGARRWSGRVSTGGFSGRVGGGRR